MTGGGVDFESGGGGGCCCDCCEVAEESPVVDKLFSVFFLAAAAAAFFFAFFFAFFPLLLLELPPFCVSAISLSKSSNNSFSACLANPSKYPIIVAFIFIRFSSSVTIIRGLNVNNGGGEKTLIFLSLRAPTMVAAVAGS